MVDISALAADILLSLHGILPGAEVVPPRMIALEPAELQRRVCGRPCRVSAWYSPEGTIYIDRRLKPARHMGHRSILVHELVHHVQRMETGKRAQNCDEWRKREALAYSAQAFWLESKGLNAGNLMLQARFLRCNAAQFKVK